MMTFWDEWADTFRFIFYLAILLVALRVLLEFMGHSFHVPMLDGILLWFGDLMRATVRWITGVFNLPSPV
jgi:hypothetical protein